ncbi:RHS repeat-associated protein [Chryseobacterium rhizosphaerae]|uniref:RHS repeat-associated core domain-containing protein n=1 Tax=Chryseobacterium rhizosphaerae TaxID=395937 RepID=UPI00285868FE|nr:RHS repeat-associated protein [Chryseobacterium rhizosphaerae]
MNHLKTGNSYFAQGSYKSNKYNGKELQETGMYSYGWREYMPDIARWNGIDQLAESYLATSPYAYVLNNPINMFDPDGRTSEPFNWRESWDATPAGTNSYWFNNGSGFTSYNGGPEGQVVVALHMVQRLILTVLLQILMELEILNQVYGKLWVIYLVVFLMGIKVQELQRFCRVLRLAE